MQVKIRLLELADYQKGLYALLSVLTKAPPSNYIEFEQVFLQMKKQGKEIFVVEHQGLLIATGSLLVEQKFIHHNGKVAYLEDIVVLNEYQDQGLGKQLADHLIARSKQLACYKIVLHCQTNRVGFYEKRGFTKSSHCMSIYF